MGVEILSACIAESAQRHADKTAIVFIRGKRVETEISYRQLNRDSIRMANYFKGQGIVKGERVVLFLEKSLVFVVAYLALHKLGAVAVPLNPGFKKAEMRYLLGDAGASLVVCGSAQQAIVGKIDPDAKRLVIDTTLPYQALTFFKAAPEIPPAADTKSQDAGLIVYTSGTTGNPKGAILTQRNLVFDAQNVIGTWEIDAADVLCHALPLFHVHGLCFALQTSLMAGATVMMLDRFDAENTLEILTDREGKYVCTVFMAVPPMYAKIIHTHGTGKLEFDHLRLLTSGSAPLPVKDFERIRRFFGKEPVEREGMTETGMNFSNPLRGKRKPGSIGLPLPGLKVRIVDPETLIDVPPGEIGELWLKSPAITPGYWRKPAETASAFENGWFRSGDLGMIDKEGYYYLVDRIKHTIISGGENISPREIETVIDQTEGVVESSVVGVADEKWGEKVVAAVVAKPKAALQPADIQHACKQHLHDWKCPKAVVFVEALPRNRMGKVLKEKVKKLFQGKG